MLKMLLSWPDTTHRKIFSLRFDKFIFLSRAPLQYLWVPRQRRSRRNETKELVSFGFVSFCFNVFLALIAMDLERHACLGITMQDDKVTRHFQKNAYGK